MATTATATSVPAAGVPAAGVPAATAPVPACPSDHGALTFEQVPARGATIRVAVYLPPCAAAGSARRYPAIYLLHGGGADETQWPAIGLSRTADQLIAARLIVPVIVVMPSSGLDPSDNSIADDVVPWADATLPTSAIRADRAIGGISAGAAAALRLVTSNPSLFARLGGHSPVVGAGTDLATWDGSVWFDVGQDDSLRPSTESAAAMLEARGVRLELHVWPGRHDRAYWGAHVADYLRFYAAR